MAAMIGVAAAAAMVVMEAARRRGGVGNSRRPNVAAELLGDELSAETLAALRAHLS
eukprot:COSAG05_NODE_8211_length_726_cov_1.046252_3_plen_56_part_00